MTSATATGSSSAASWRATSIGVLAILLWASLALLTVHARGIPSFELLALSFGVAFLSGLAALGLLGTAALLLGRDLTPLSASAMPGYAAAFACAFIWAWYSVVNRRFGATPSGMLVGVVLIAGDAVVATLRLQ